MWRLSLYARPIPDDRAMRSGLWRMIGATSLLAALIGCGGGSGTGTGGSSGGGPGGSGTGGSNVAGHGGTGAGGSLTGTGGAGAGGAGGGSLVTRDCLPACIANLRSGCERPLVDAGSCTSQADAAGVYCYSNGVRETQGPVDGGFGTATITKPDGHTICYQIFRDRHLRRDDRDGEPRYLRDAGRRGLPAGRLPVVAARRVRRQV